MWCDLMAGTKQQRENGVTSSFFRSPKQMSNKHKAKLGCGLVVNKQLQIARA